jgi:hypothetical protein
MATKYWTASAVQQYDRWDGTVAGTWAAGDTATITINGKSLVVTIGSLVTTAQVATTIVQAFNKSLFTDTTATVSPSSGGLGILEFTGMAASVSNTSASVVQILNRDASEATITMSETTAGNGTLTASHGVTATGPNYWSATTNWDTGTIPVANDTVIIDSPVSIRYGSLDQSAITVTQLTFGSKFTRSAEVGLLPRNPYNYQEFRPTKLKIGATTVTNNSSSSKLCLNNSSIQTALTQTGASTLYWIGTHASNVVTINAGTAYLAYELGEVATIATLNIQNASVLCGSGLTITTINKRSGTISVNSSTTTFVNESGNGSILGGTHASLTITGGSIESLGSTIVTLLKMTGGSFRSSATTASSVTINKLAGTIMLAVAPTTTLTSSSGDTTCESGGISGVTTINGGTFNWTGAGTIASLVTTGSPTINFDGGTTAACTVSANSFSKGTTIIDSAKRVVYTGGLIAPAGTTTFS